PDDIAVITPYLGQLHQLRRLMQSIIRLATVDNFQGEEAKVVVVSLVRSNQQNKCGFLSTPNRINVLLSRAQHGMYLIGNSKT
ncbi:AAA domain-containing protein, partial [Truncatella angustata]